MAFKLLRSRLGFGSEDVVSSITGLVDRSVDNFSLSAVLVDASITIYQIGKEALIVESSRL